MLLHLTGKPENDQILCTLPDLNFTTKQTVQVIQMLIEWVEPVENIHGSLSSSLIDCSIMNPNQILCFFSQTVRSKHLLVSPPSDINFNIQLWSLQQAIFKIHKSEKHQIKKIQFFLKISDGIQSNTQKTLF